MEAARYEKYSHSRGRGVEFFSLKKKLIREFAEFYWEGIDGYSFNFGDRRGRKSAKEKKEMDGWFMEKEKGGSGIRNLV